MSAMTIDPPGTEEPDKSTPLSPDDPRLATTAARKTSALLASRVAQFNNYSCSAAAVATVVNAIRRLSGASGSSKPLSPQEILSRVDCHHWRERVSDRGYRGRHGMPLFEFGEALRAALDACRIFAQRLEVIGFHPGMNDLADRRAGLEQALRAFAALPGDFLIAHFTQGVYFGDWYGGHISPVGAYDERSGQVLVIDVDPECPSPYWVSFERFFEGLLGRAKIIGAKGGGYVRVGLQSR
jgi:hypothetical protein